MAKQVEQLLEEQRERRRVAGLRGDELTAHLDEQQQARRRAKHDELKTSYLEAFQEFGGTPEEFEALWPNLGQSVIGSKAMKRVDQGKASMRRQVRSIWAGHGGQGISKGGR